MLRETDLVEFIKMNIKRYQLTQKAYSGLRLSLIGLFEYAKLYGYTEISISTFFSDLSLSRNMFKKKRKTDSENVFTVKEAEVLKQYLWDHPTIHNLGLLLMFETGSRRENYLYS